MRPDSVTKLYLQLRSYYAKMHKRMQATPDLLSHKYRGLPQLPQGVAVHETSTAETIIDNLVDQIRTDEPSVYFEAKGKTQKDFIHKELMELWGRHVIIQLHTHSFIAPEDQVVRDALTRDAACVKFLVDEDALIDAPTRDAFKTQAAFTKALRKWRADSADRWPFVVRPVDPLRVYVAPGNARPPAFIIEHQERRVIDIVQKYGDVWARAGHPAATPEHWMDKCSWVEYWGAEDYIVEVDGVEVLARPNAYGILPYAFGYTGRGRLNWDGEPEELVYPVLLPHVGELEAEVRLKTALDAAWQFYVFKRLLTTGDPRIMARALQKGPGAVIKIEDMNQPPQWLEEPQPNEAALIFLREVKDAIEKRFPTGLMQRPEGVGTGVQQALLVGQALKPLLPIKGLLNSLMGDVLNGLAHMMYVLDLPMNVFGTVGEVAKERTVKGGDFTARNFSVKYEATDPAEDDRRILTGLALLREKSAQGSPIISRRTFREVYAPRVMPNSDEEEEQVLVEGVVDQVLGQGMLLQVVTEMMQGLQQEDQEKQAALGLQGQIRQAGGQVVPGARERAMEGLMGAPVQRGREGAQEGFETGGV